MAACSVRAAASISGFNGGYHGSRCNLADNDHLCARDRQQQQFQQHRVVDGDDRRNIVFLADDEAMGVGVRLVAVVLAL